MEQHECSQYPKFEITEYKYKYSVHYFVDLQVFHDLVMRNLKNSSDPF